MPGFVRLGRKSASRIGLIGDPVFSPNQKAIPYRHRSVGDLLIICHGRLISGRMLTHQCFSEAVQEGAGLFEILPTISIEPKKQFLFNTGKNKAITAAVRIPAFSAEKLFCLKQTFF